MRASAYPMIRIPEAEAIVLASTRAPGVDRAELVSLPEALGRVLAADVVAPDALPPFPASIKACVVEKLQS
jgi:gephyrin